MRGNLQVLALRHNGGVELRGCVEAEVALLGSRSLMLSLVVSVDVKQC